MKEQINIGIIGTGFAKTVQIPAFQKIAGAKVVSVASAHLANAEKVAQDFGVEHFTNDWRETVERDDVDLICITTPPVLHYEQTMFALEHGKNVLCEKPTTMDADEAKAMLDTAKEKNVLALIDHELRFLNGRREAFKLIRDGEIGEIRHIKYNFRAPHRGSADAPWTWWSDKSQGGGALGAIGSHAIDSLRWFSGAEISEVFCQLQSHIKQRLDAKTNEPREVTSDDEVNMILRFASGELVRDATANVSLSMVEYPAYQNRIEIFGTKNSLRVEFDGELFIGDVKNETWTKREIELNDALDNVKNTGWNNGFSAFAAEIIEALKRGETTIENAATFEDGWKNQIVLDAARQSNKNGSIVKI